MKYTFNEFYCISCGNKNIDLPRKQSKQRERFHRKKMYCFHCKKTVNMVECKTPDDVEIFKEEFESGKYINEALESEEFCEAFC